MADMEDAIYARLVSQLGHTRIYPGTLPQKVTLPAVRYHRLGRNPVRAMQSNSGMQRPHFQFDTWGKTITEAQTEAAKIYTAFERWTGTSGGITVAWSALEDEIEGLNAEVGDFRVTQRFEFAHYEA